MRRISAVKACQLLQLVPVDNGNLLAAKSDHSLGGEALEQAADNFSHATQFFGQTLVRGMDGSTLGEQQFGQALVEALKRDFLDQLQQLRDAVAKKVEDEVPEQAILGDQFLEQGNWQEQQREGCFGDAAG